MQDIPQHKGVCWGNVVKVGYPSFTNQSQTQEEQKCSSGYFLYWFILFTSFAFATVICMSVYLLQSSHSGSVFWFFFFRFILFFLKRGRPKRDCLTFLFPYKCSPGAQLNIICHRRKFYLLLTLTLPAWRLMCARMCMCVLGDAVMMKLTLDLKNRWEMLTWGGGRSCNVLQYDSKSWSILAALVTVASRVHQVKDRRKWVVSERR